MSIQVCLISWMNFDYEENGGKKHFSCKSKALISCIQYGKHGCSAQSKKKWRLLWDPMFLSFHWWTLIIKEMVERVAFLANQRHQHRVSLCGKHGCSAQAQKKWRSLWDVKFVLFHRWTLIIRKMVKRKVLLASPKHQYRVSQYEEHDCSAQSKK